MGKLLNGKPSQSPKITFAKIIKNLEAHVLLELIWLIEHCLVDVERELFNYKWNGDHRSS